MKTHTNITLKSMIFILFFVGIVLGIHMYLDSSSGLRLSADNISPTGFMLQVSQQGFTTFDRFIYLDSYWLEYRSEGEWLPVDPFITKETVTFFDAEKGVVHKGETVELQINWKELYGKLSPGEYRLSQYITGQNEKQAETRVYSVSFTIAE